jgi:anti-sigma factor RsiW
MTDAVSENDLHAYVDGELEPSRLLVVEDYLARNPQVAARVMADLRSRDVLKLALGAVHPKAAPGTIDAADRLETGMFWRGLLKRFRKVAAVGSLIALGWLAHDESGLLHVTGSEAAPVTPAFLEDALQAHRTEVMRSRFSSQAPSQAPSQSYDRDEILAATRIEMPALPPAWQVTDVQVFPAHQGSSVEASVQAGSLGKVSLFAAQVDSDVRIPPTMTRNGNDTTIYWQKNSLLFAITGEKAGRPLRRAAHAIYDTMR